MKMKTQLITNLSNLIRSQPKSSIINHIRDITAQINEVIDHEDIIVSQTEDCITSMDHVSIHFKTKKLKGSGKTNRPISEIDEI